MKDLVLESKRTFKPNDIVKTCPYIEIGSCFSLDGIKCCVHGSMSSPLLINKDELNNKEVTYETVVQRREELFEAVNGLNDKYPDANCMKCANLIEKEYKDVNFEYMGGMALPASFNIQHYTECNQRCSYCCYAQKNLFFKPQYNIIDFMELFRKEGKLRGGNWIDFSGGEPAMLKNFDEILKYLLDNNVGTVDVYSNALLYSQSIYDALKENKIVLTTSLDTGIASTYKDLRGVNCFDKVFQNLIRYRMSGTKGLWIKYIVCDRNRTEDDLWSFIAAILAIKPNKVMICPDFPYGDKQISDETVDFAAKLWHLVEKFTNITPIEYTSGFGEAKFVKYHKDLQDAIQRYREKDPFDGNYQIYKSEIEPVHVNFLQTIFSVRNENEFKIIRVLGFKVKVRRKSK